MRAVEPPQRRADQLKGVLPRDRHVTVGRRVVAHRLNQPPRGLEVVITPPLELGDGVGSEEVPVDLLAGQLPGDVLDPVLAEIEVQAGRVVGPRAPRTVKATVLLVHHEQRADPLLRDPGFLEHTPDAPRRPPARSRMIVVVEGEVTRRDGAATQRRHSRGSAEHSLQVLVHTALA
jgi:hypothetical protein